MLRTEIDEVKDDLTNLLATANKDDYGQVHKKNDVDRFRSLFGKYLNLATQPQQLQELREILRQSGIYENDIRNMLVEKYLHLACAQNPRKCEDFSWIAEAFNYTYLKPQHQDIIEEAWLPLCQTVAQKVAYYLIFENGDSIKEILSDGISKEDLILVIDQTSKDTTLHTLALEEWKKLPCVCRTDPKIEKEASSCKDPSEE